MRSCDDLRIELENSIINNLLEWCYELDKNEMPPRYKLRRIDEILTSFDEKVTENILRFGFFKKFQFI